MGIQENIFLTSPQKICGYSSKVPWQESEASWRGTSRVPQSVFEEIKIYIFIVKGT